MQNWIEIDQSEHKGFRCSLFGRGVSVCVCVLTQQYLRLQNWTVHGLYWGSHRIHRPHVLEDSLKELLSWLADGLITVKISHTFSLREVSYSDDINITMLDKCQTGDGFCILN